MQLTKDEHLVFNYSDVFFSYHFSHTKTCSSMARDHYLVYIYSGEYHIIEGKKKTIIRPGECVFVRRDNRVNMEKISKADEPFRGIFMNFKRPFLRGLFQEMEKKQLPEGAGKFKQSVIKLPDTPDIKGLFLSMTAYFDSSIKPTEDMMNLKLTEGIYSLLNIDIRFYPTLFDFNQPWKIDLLEFMEQNYMYDLTMQEMASFTGRSLSTFKRDFRKISSLPPQKWLIQRRLKAAYHKIREEGQRVSDVYMEVGFKNLSHFSSAFKKQYGFSPGS